MSFDEIKQNLSLIADPVEKLEFVMDLGKELSPIPENAKCNEILGCTSFVQICEKDGRFYGSADSAMVRGIVVIILSMIDGKSVDEIKKMDLMSEFNALNLNFGALVGARDICIRVGNMCASWIHKKLGIDGSCRISVGPWNTMDDAVYVIDVIKKLVK